MLNHNPKQFTELCLANLMVKHQQPLFFGGESHSNFGQVWKMEHQKKNSKQIISVSAPFRLVNQGYYRDGAQFHSTINIVNAVIAGFNETGTGVAVGLPRLQIESVRVHVVGAFPTTMTVAHGGSSGTFFRDKFEDVFSS